MSDYDLYTNAICAIRRLRGLLGRSTRITFDCKEVFDEEGDFDGYVWFGWIGRHGSKYFIEGTGQTPLALFQNLHDKVRKEYDNYAKSETPQSLRDLGLSVRASNAIENLYGQYNIGYHHAKDIKIDWITDIGRHQFFKLPNVGKKTLHELEEELARYGLKLRDDKVKGKIIPKTR